MKKFITNCVLLGIPLLVYILVIAVIDPYNYLNLWKRLDQQVNDDIAQHVEPHLFKMERFHDAPTGNIILGDSRSNGLYARLDHKRWSNLAYGGSSLQEIIETFWWATKEVKMDTVIIGINLNLYNRYNKKFWIRETIERRKNFFSYAFNRYTFQSGLMILQSYLSDRPPVLYKPPGSKEEFWKYTISEMGEKFYQQFAYPQEYYSGLKDISEYCKRNNIVLIMWIPPTHVEFQKIKEDFGLGELDRRFVSDLRSLAELYDFDFPSEVTRNKEDYRDPMHFDVRVGEIVREEILSRSPKYARYSVPGVISTKESEAFH